MSVRTPRHNEAPMRIFFACSLLWTLLCALALLSEPRFEMEGAPSSHGVLLLEPDAEPTSRWTIEAEDVSRRTRPDPTQETRLGRPLTPEEISALEEAFWDAEGREQADVLAGVLQMHRMASGWSPFLPDARLPEETIRPAIPLAAVPVSTVRPEAIKAQPVHWKQSPPLRVMPASIGALSLADFPPFPKSALCSSRP